MAQIHMGDRTLIQVRVPDEIAELLDEDMARAGFKHRSRFLASVIAERYGRHSPDAAREDHSRQGTLAIDAA